MEPKSRREKPRAKKSHAKTGRGKDDAIRSNGKRTLADKADKFVCYEKSVQSPEHEVEFFGQAYQDAFGRKPVSLREDFCGTFSVCCHWVQADPARTAIGVDLCAETLAWGRSHNLAKLNSDQQARVTLLEQDVRKGNSEPVDVLAAQNFSFWIFKTREEVVDYFRAAYHNMAQDSVMIMDMMGGGDCYIENHVDKRKIRKGKKGFSYHWRQVSFNPVNAHAKFRIDFKFADGSWIKRAFEYDWRFWTIPEVREMLAEAGFRESHVYWELEDEDGEDTGVWQRGDDAPAHPSWVNYVVGLK